MSASEALSPTRGPRSPGPIAPARSPAWSPSSSPWSSSSPTAAAAGTRFKAVDESRQHVAANWVSHVFDVAEPNAAILSWWSYSTPLWYAQRVQGERPDVAIIDDRTRLDEDLGGLTETIDANLGKRPVYVIRADPREVKLLADRYELDYIDGTDASKLTRVIGLKGAAGS